MIFLFLACHAGGAGRRRTDGTVSVQSGSAELPAEPEPEIESRNFEAVILGSVPGKGSLYGLSLYDQIAFSCRFMDDVQLASLLRRVEADATEKGMLSSLVLTGLTPRSMPLLQKFVDNSGDIQTAVLLMCHVVPRRFPQPIVERWISDYRELLDRWQLFHERCLLDICLVPYSGRKPPPQIFARCQFCNQSLAFTSTPREGSVVRQVKLASGQQPSLRLSCCPACKKPLPRCAVCLQPLDCANPQPEDTKQLRERSRRLANGCDELEPWRSAAASNFRSWFAWCQSCGHGGHAGHLKDWFDEYPVCPVSGCHCHCSLLM